MSRYNAEGPVPSTPPDPPMRPMGRTIKRGSRPLTNRMLREAMQQYALSSPRKIGDGQATFASSTTIDSQPFKWDTNCFYRRLGLEPDAPRIEIVRRFLELDPQQNFLYLATAAEVLLSKDKRSRYDRLIIGTFWGGDPDLIKSQINGEMAAPDQGSWTVYADLDITDEDARTLTSDWRNKLSAALAPRLSKLPIMPEIGVGVCRSIFLSRWEMIGHYAVFFVSLDAEATPEYVLAAADELLRIATPTVITDS